MRKFRNSWHINEYFGSWMKCVLWDYDIFMLWFTWELNKYVMWCWFFYGCSKFKIHSHLFHSNILCHDMACLTGFTVVYYEGIILWYELVVKSLLLDLEAFLPANHSTCNMVCAIIIINKFEINKRNELAVEDALLAIFWFFQSSR